MGYYDNALEHHGILGQKWGVRRFENKDGTLTSAGRTRYHTDSEGNYQKLKTEKSNYAEESSKNIKTNTDGSKTIPKGFVFNRVGKQTMDINKSGALYVSYGKEDAARYVKNLGPTPLSKLLGTAGEAVQHISVKKSLKMPSDTEVAKETVNLLMSNSKLLNEFNESIYSSTVTGDFSNKISKSDLQKTLLDPSGKSAQKLAYGVSSFLGDENYASESKTVYEHFRNKGYDAIPDVHDRLSGTSSTALIVINPDKLEVTSSTVITKDIMKEAKNYIKTLENLKVSELIK